MSSDFHLHTSFSGDSDSSPTAMAEAAAALGMRTICFTDHMDTDSQEEGFILDTDAYLCEMVRIQEKYRDKIDIRIGVELGMQEHLAQRHYEYVQKYPFDLVIASLHLVDGKDPYYPEVFAGREDKEVYRSYFESLLANVKAFSGYQVLGHIDYVVRYGRHKAQQYGYNEYADIIDEILLTVIQNGCGIEINTAGFKHDLGFANPHPDIISRYKELGGEIVTIGSDAHSPAYIGYRFNEAKYILKEAGFDYYCQFRQGRAEFVQV